MRQNATHYAAKRIALCGKMQGRFAAKQGVILPQNAEKKSLHFGVGKTLF